ncbi:hypothetical protein BJ508DRAFT_411036 [Ascobolus immersus RN42]|uniref:LysM domain-containing protein n=1 Tax=Ascobolus immersus RN42 TaxID=1160509 RepID=A0A3N4IQ61_ASCIM|nr:hypothetical protein BJ508DRAFT_411036 [Ascobolus immersus RN42]
MKVTIFTTVFVLLGLVQLVTSRPLPQLIQLNQIMNPVSGVFSSICSAVTCKSEASIQRFGNIFFETTCRRKHEARPGEHCYGIAQTYGISLDEFFRLNLSVKTDCSDLIAGRAYCVEN